MELDRFIHLPNERLLARGEELEELLNIPRDPDHPRTRSLEREMAHIIFELAARYAEDTNGNS